MKDYGTAFPTIWINDDKSQDSIPGMSKRFYAACMAMQGLLANPYPDIVRMNDNSVCEMAFKIADEMLKQEGEK